MSDKRYIINVQGAIYRGDRFLLAKRSQAEEFMPGILGLPGGTIEAEDEASDDVILSTLRREIREEVNVEVTDCQLVISRYFEADGDPVVNLVFLCRYLSGEAAAIDPDEVEEIYWMTVEDAIKQENCREWTQLYLERADSLRKKIQQTG